MSLPSLPPGTALKSGATGLLLALVASSAFAASSPGSAGAAPAIRTVFSAVGPDYKKPRELPDDFFNPFKVEIAPEGGLAKRGGPITGEAVAEAVGRRGVSGLVFAPAGGSNRVIIGNEIFQVGDELSFPDAGRGSGGPLIAGATVTLREVRGDHLAFDVAADGEATRRVNFPLRSFWKP